MFDNNLIKKYIKNSHPQLFRVIKFPKTQIVKLKVLISYLIYRLYIVIKVPQIRKKRQIKVLYVLAELATWKSEMLYHTMLDNPKFEPILGVTTNSIEAPGSKPILEKYLKEKGYEYVDLDKSHKSIDIINPDFILYYKPYDASYPPEQIFWKHKKAIPLGLNYGISMSRLPQHYSQPLFQWCFQMYVENDLIKGYFKKAIGFRAFNVKVTGTPMEDQLLLPKMFFTDPWKDKTGKKRIIYAPHHSFKGSNGQGVELATFLENGEFMLDMAKKYKDTVTFAFKPHPNLRKKLVKIWGKEKTDAYYQEWESLDYAQVDYGDYVSLFKYSDAIIHDSSSFMIEYMFMNQPSMYLILDSVDFVKKELNGFAQESFDCYEHGVTHEQIEAFINNVINGVDKLKDKRQLFYDEYLKPPYGRSACENIICSILGEKL